MRVNKWVATAGAVACVLATGWAGTRNMSRGAQNEPNQPAANQPVTDPPSDPVPTDLAGTWHNELGSVMELKVDANSGMLSGTYQNAASTPTPNAKYPITGWVNGDVISFTVNWSRPDQANGKRFPSLATWTGQHSLDPKTNQPTIKTLWYLSRNVPDAAEKKELWSAVRSGSDTFSPGPAPAPR